MTLIPFRIKAEMTAKTSTAAMVLVFGYGTRETAAHGLTRLIQSWDVELVFDTISEDRLFLKFVADYQQHSIFQWKSPTDTVPEDYRISADISGLVRCGDKTNPHFFRRTTQLRRVYG